MVRSSLIHQDFPWKCVDSISQSAEYGCSSHPNNNYSYIGQRNDIIFYQYSINDIQSVGSSIRNIYLFQAYHNPGLAIIIDVVFPTCQKYRSQI